MMAKLPCQDQLKSLEEKSMTQYKIYRTSEREKVSEEKEKVEREYS